MVGTDTENCMKDISKVCIKVLLLSDGFSNSINTMTVLKYFFKKY